MERHKIPPSCLRGDDSVRSLTGVGMTDSERFNLVFFAFRFTIALDVC